MLACKVFMIAVFVIAQVAAEFPTFIKRCSKSDLNFDKCLIENGNYAFSHILNGVPELYLPSLLNLRTGPLDYDASEYIHFHSDDGVAISRDMSIADIKFDPETSIKFRIRTGFSKIRLNFIANGTILEKPILEKGYANMTFYNTDFTFEAKLESKALEGINHYQISNYITSFVKFQKFDYKTFDQESIKEPMTWRQRKIFNKSLPLIEASMAELMGKLGAEIAIFIFNTIFMLVPQEEVFLP